MIIRRTIELTACLAFATLATTACTQAVDSAGGQSSSSAIEPASSAVTATDEAGSPKHPRFVLADVVDSKDVHALVPFVLPEPKGAPGLADEGAAKLAPPPCLVHRTSSADADTAMMPPPPPAKVDGAPPAPPPDEKPEGGGKPEPLMLQIAVFASAADASAGTSASAPSAGTKPKLPVVVVQCFGAPGEMHVDVPHAILDDALTGLGSGATARVALAGFRLPPPPPKDSAPSGGAPSADAPKGPPPPVGRGVFTIASVTSTTSLDALLADFKLPL